MWNSSLFCPPAVTDRKAHGLGQSAWKRYCRGNNSGRLLFCFPAGLWSCCNEPSSLCSYPAYSYRRTCRPAPRGHCRRRRCWRSWPRYNWTRYRTNLSFPLPLSQLRTCRCRKEQNRCTWIHSPGISVTGPAFSHAASSAAFGSWCWALPCNKCMLRYMQTKYLEYDNYQTWEYCPRVPQARISEFEGFLKFSVKSDLRSMLHLCLWLNKHACDF